MGKPTTQFPGKSKFAFTILDDTDDATVENVKPVYDLLTELGMRTTKTVWPLACPEGSRLYFAGETLEDADYLSFLRDLVRMGFEIAFHGATMETSDRERTLRGLGALSAQLGVTPTLHCNHGQNLENLYWGAARYRTLAIRLPLTLLERVLGRPKYFGHVPGSAHFWGDIAKRQFRFVRNFTFTTVDSGGIPPFGPYRLESTPWVQHWFNTADAPDATHFKRLLTAARIDRLRDAAGTCILSTHLGKGFTRHGRVDPQIEDTLRYIASQPGWFIPVSDLLEHLLAARANDKIAPWTRWQLELSHLADRVRTRFFTSSETGPA